MNGKKRNKKRKSGSIADGKTEKTAKIECQPSAESLECRRVYAHDINRLLNACPLVVIRGPIASGKTYSAIEAARLAGMPLIRIHVNEDFDVKALFGAYKCTDIPGEFTWTPSEFTKHLSENCYILLEELDAGSPDLVAALLTLCERREYILQTGERRPLHEHCRILATVEAGRESNLNLICDHLFFVDVPPLTNVELDAIAFIGFPAMTTVRQRSLEIFTHVRHFIACQCPLERQLNAKDFFRLCRRFNDVNFTSNEVLWREMFDVWCAHLSTATSRTAAGELLGAELSLSAAQVRTLADLRRPDVAAAGDVLRIGHTTLVRHQTSLGQTTRSLGMTRDCCQLLERLARAVNSYEPVLLTGETGVGKTSVVQLLADYCGRSLRTVNMSQDSEFADLIGGYKPTPVINLVSSLADKYVQLFRSTLDATKNTKFLSYIDKSLAAERVTDVLKLIAESSERAASSSAIDTKPSTAAEWRNMEASARRLLQYVEGSRCAFPFAYVAGVVTRAAAAGDWLLVDEINLAPSECLDAIMQVIDGNAETTTNGSGSITMVHPDFRLFACQNPATDVGKRVLAVNVRSRFVEFFVAEPTQRESIDVIVRNYLPAVEFEQLEQIWRFYETTMTSFPRKYSMRTLCRALKIIARNLKSNLKREASLMSLAFSISFTSNLDVDEQTKLSTAVEKHFGRPTPTVLSAATTAMKRDFVAVEGSWIRRGDVVPADDPHFIFTPSVRANLALLASVVANGEFPVLLEGETSAGKTSMIQYLAKITGNRVHRINNHEHTDIQEYIGSYAPNAAGQIEFIEGVLLLAVRKGEWIILDELNLAPSIVLEALNRLLDDNREIFVTELNETVAAHPRFRLFATQNPVGHYAGRKRLSAAFLNRFVVLKYEHLPFGELPAIVEGRCGVAPSMAAKMVDVLVELRARRSVHGIFAQAAGLMTLRDLFRWATRVARTAAAPADDFDWRQIAAEQGFFVLASRCRNADDERLVVDVLEAKLQRRIDADVLFAADSPYFPKELAEQRAAAMPGVVMTQAMRRMAILCAEAWKFHEPVLLVGETGCGKTTVVHLLTDPLSINCHERTETSDFLGSVRPTTGGRFQWHDGIVVRAMKAGRTLLVDEISLAPDSVLERLNSLLETDRSILLTDGGALETETIVADDNFQFVGTMNPGDDHGKKELSKALRNRFLEIWCAVERSADDLRIIVRRRLELSAAFANDGDEMLATITSTLVEFFERFRQKTQRIFTMPMTIRDLINVVNLLGGCVMRGLTPSDAIHHAVGATLFDAFGVLPARIPYDAQALTAACRAELDCVLKTNRLDAVSADGIAEQGDIRFTDEGLYVGPFLVPYGVNKPNESFFAFDAPTPRRNLFCVVRGMTVENPIMLEGSPGAGKSSLIVALAEATGHPLVRLNLSEQTDLSDLFGSDVPHTSPNGTTTFTWCDGPVLRAIKEGAWVLLDEMNLASQSVLEGLNSCFDFRRNLYISELNRTFEIESTGCRMFACQNPRSQGGDRKALPKSFINRFTSIYVNDMTNEDYLYILRKRFTVQFANDATNERTVDLLLQQMVATNSMIAKIPLCDGGPFEFNLRDLLRWASYVFNRRDAKDEAYMADVRFGFQLVYTSRLRNDIDITAFVGKFERAFMSSSDLDDKDGRIQIECKPNMIGLGGDNYNFIDSDLFDDIVAARQFESLASQAEVVRRLAACADMNWLALLVGDFSASLRADVETLAALAGRRLAVLRLTAETDSLELLGSYEQVADKNDAGTTATTFQWIDSEFVNAYRDGQWILIQDVNCCSSAVLDCLNCCLEDEGRLMLSERSDGQATVIRRHSGFRVFFTMDPRNGLLSRAMRNRSVEIFVGSGAFWHQESLDKHFNLQSQSADCRVRPEVLNWIVSASFGSMWRDACAAAALDQCGAIGQLRELVDERCREIVTADKMSAFFKELMSGNTFRSFSFVKVLTRFALCYPFAMPANHDKFVSGHAMELSTESSHCGVRAYFAGVFSELYALLATERSSRRSLLIDYDFEAVEWIDGRHEDICLSALVLNSKPAPGSMNLHGLVSGQLLTMLASRHWTEYGCSLAPQRAHIAELDASSTELKWLVNTYWMLLFSHSYMREKIRSKIEGTVHHLGVRRWGMCDTRDMKSIDKLADLIGVALALLSALTPSKVESGEDFAVRLAADLNGRRDWDRLRVVEMFLDAVQRFLMSTLGGYDAAFFDNLRLPLVRSLWRLRHDAAGNSANVFNVFRPAGQSFRNLVNLLGDFLATAVQFERVVLHGDIVAKLRQGGTAPMPNSSQRLRLVSQIESFLTSATFFKRSAFANFSGYPDVILPYMTVIDVALLGVHALSRRIQQMHAELELQQKHGCPRELIMKSQSLDAHRIDHVVEWCLGEHSPLPACFQLQLLEWQTSIGGKWTSACRCWLSRQWRNRHEKSVKRVAETFVYKSRASKASENSEDNDEDSMEDEDRIEFERYFPNYSNESLALDDDEKDDSEVDDKPKPERSIADRPIGDEEIVALICRLEVKQEPSNALKTTAAADTIPYFPLMKLLECVNLGGILQDDDESLLKYHHLLYLHRASQHSLVPARSIKPTPERGGRVLDVYTESDAGEVTRCVVGVNRLRRQIATLREEFPENQVLVSLSDSIAAFLRQPPTQPLMRLTALLEKLLVESDQWQQLADRAHSIRDEMSALQRVLVDWRRLEVLCWADVVARIRRDFRDAAVIHSRPLFDAVEALVATNCKDAETKILLMLVEWLQNASLADFDARLLTGEILARFVELERKESGCDLPDRLRRLVRYFRVFAGPVGDRLAVASREIEAKLRDFVEIFKYNDLNLWSIKQSTQKVHGQLFRIIKKFKETCRDPVIGTIFDTILPIPATPVADQIAPTSVSDGAETDLATKFHNFTTNFDVLLTRVLDADALRTLGESTADLGATLQTDIVYIGDEEERKKQHGRELNRRQKRFAYLLREYDAVGIDSEALTVRMMAGAHLDQSAGGADDPTALLTRHSAAARNVFRKRFAAFRAALQEEISKQVPVRRLSAMTEHGLQWLVNACEALADGVDAQVIAFDRLAAELAVLVENAEQNIELDHVRVSEALSYDLPELEGIIGKLTLLADVLAAAPIDDTAASTADKNLMRLTAEMGANQLANWTKSTCDYQMLVKKITGARDSIQQLVTKRQAIRRTPTGFWKSAEVTDYRSSAQCTLREFRHKLEAYAIYDHFSAEFSEMDKAAEKLLYGLDTDFEVSSMSDLKRADFDAEMAVRTEMQVIYDLLGAIGNSASEKKSLDVVREVISLLTRSKITAIHNSFTNFLADLAGGRQLASASVLRQSLQLCEGLRGFLRFFANHSSVVVREFARCYLHFEEIAVRLLSHGFVNALPRTDDNAEGEKDGKSADASTTDGGDGDCQGMGTAKVGESAAPDAKDVADELEETGQLDGLKEDEAGNKPDDSQQPPPAGDNPIEIEEDFAVGLEDLDGEDIDEDAGGQQDDGQEEADDRLDWEKGDVKAPEERQLDPELWDRPADALEPEAVDEDDASGTNRETDEMVARDDKAAALDKKEEDGDGDEEREADASAIDGENGEEDDQPADDPSFTDFDSDGYDNECENTEENGSEKGDEKDDEDVDETSADQPPDGAMDVDKGEAERPDDEPTVSRDDGVDKTAQISAEEQKGLGRGIGEKKEDAEEDKNTSGVKNDGADEQTGDNDESRKTARQKSRDGNEKNRECEAEDANTTGEDAAAERRPDHDDRAELAARDDELFKRADNRTQPPRQWGSDEEDIAEEFDENGEEAFAAECDQRQNLRHVVQKASAEEAAQTRDLLRRLEDQQRTADGERPLENDNADTKMDTAEEEDDVEMLPDTGRTSDDIVIISKRIRQMVPLMDGDAAPLSLLEDRGTADEMDAGRALAMELRWSNISGFVAQLASMLAENLRIILEPTVASRLQGDYRTGKRLNVRRLIAYVASDYRKDRIWMRRTKKVKRNYQIVIAVDDSASMRDNRMSAITCHSLCLIEKALRQLEVGQLMICKFGADVKILSDFGTAGASADAALGARLMHELTFAQQRTDLANLLAMAGSKFAEAAGSSGAFADRILIILGDGRGVMAEGVERIRQALKRLDQDEITVLFIIVNTPKPSETADGASRSIFDIRVVTGYARNEAGQLRANFRPYMELFPFPFYVVVNDVEQLPTAISNAIQQWFEFTTR